MKISLLTQKNVYIKKMKLKHFQASLKKLYKRYSSRENDPNGKYWFFLKLRWSGQKTVQVKIESFRRTRMVFPTNIYIVGPIEKKKQ